MLDTRLGPYQIHTELGAGGMGTVYRAEVAEETVGLPPGSAVAVKVIHPHLLAEPGFFKRFLREAQIGQQVRHENVVRTFDCDATLQDQVQQNFLVMEYVEGQTLRDLLREMECAPEALCRHIAHQVARGLAAIHEAGALHRDIKPENVLITRDHVVKIMDLGVARLRDEAIRLSQAGAFVGSLEYAAPEQFVSGGADADGRADLHALGVLLYELTTGSHPYRDEDARAVLRRILDEVPRNVGEVNPQLSPFMEEVVTTLLAKDREERFSSAAELAEALAEGEAGDWWRGHAKALRLKTRQPLRRIRVQRETALYGRDAELAAMQALFEQAKAGDGQVLLVGGEAGIGKTRLIDEFVGHLRQAGEDVNFLFGSYPPGGAATAAGAFSEAYREQFGAEGAAPWLSEAATLVPAFDALLRGEPPPRGEEPLTKDSIGTVFVRATQNLAAERPTIVLIDDLHFAPEDARSLFTTMAMAVPGHRVLLVGTMRPGVDAGWTADLTRLEHAAQRDLGRLGPKDLTRLLKDAFRSERLAQELGFRIAEKSDGNPFFAFEIIRGLREGQLIAQEADGAWVSTQVIRDIQIPSSVLDLVQARLGDLSEQERELLDVAACCGFEFDPLLVAAALELDQITAMKRLAHMERKHRLVRAMGRRYVFDHHQVQEALYEGMPELLREPYHARLAATLEARHDAPENEIAVQLCEHALAGGDAERAARHLPAATQHLRDGYLVDEAIDLSRRALAVDGLLAGRRRAEVMLRLSDDLEMRGRHEEDREVLEEALALTEAIEEKALQARVHTNLGRLCIWSAAREEAEQWLTTAADLAREAGDRRVEVAALGNLGIVYYRQRRFDDCRPLFERAYEAARKEGNERSMAVATLNLGNVFWCLGDFDRAQAHYERYGEISRGIGYRPGEALAAGNLGNVLLSRGRLAEAKERYQAVLSIAEEIGDRHKLALFRTSLATVETFLGRPDRARPLLESALALAREIGMPREEANALTALGALEGTREKIDEALTILRRIGGIDEQIGGLRELARLAPEESEAHVAEALALSREVGHAAYEMIFLALLGRTRKAEALLVAQGATFGVFTRMEGLYLLHRATGETRHLEEARRLLDGLIEYAPPEDRESLISGHPLHRAIRDAAPDG